MSFPLAIVIPAYKSTFLHKTLESIANQTDKRFTLYIGDDCSPNDIEIITNKFTEKINIRYHRFKENLGAKDLTAHWERCIGLTENEDWIWLFSDDDIMECNCVELFYEHLQNICHSELFHFDINLLDSSNGDKIELLPTFPQNLTAGEFLESKIKGKLLSFVVEFIFQRKVYEKIGGFQKFDLAWGSDFLTWLKIASISRKGITTISGENCKILWRKSKENISPNKSQPILIRKLYSLIDNAVFINNELKHYPKRYLPVKRSFRWIRFPLGEIWRNRNYLSIVDILKITSIYLLKIGGIYGVLNTKSHK